MALTPGTRVGAYEISALLGVGGMGEVYRAYDAGLKRDVAIKVLPASVAGDPERMARFQREAEVLASLNHPHIAHVYGREDAALIMELVEGEDLAQRIARGPLPLDEALPIARQIADALEAAHAAGIVHRDLKPANIKVRADGLVKVLDFGLAKAIEPPATHDHAGLPTHTSPAMTMHGAILGTAAYMSPEQARGRPVDTRADIWAFGVVVFEMLTGRRAFPGDDVSETLASVLARQPDWTQMPAGVPPTLLRYLQRCVEKDVRQRVCDIGDVRLALDGAFDVPPSTTGAATVRSPWARLWPIVAVAGWLVALATYLLSTPGTRESARVAASSFEIRLPGSQSLQNPQRPVLAISADGRSVAYRAHDGIRVRTLDQLQSRLVPGTSGEPVTGPFTAPFFSPDGQWIGYFADDGLKKIAVGGGTPVTLVGATTADRTFGVRSFGATWTGDGTILFGHMPGIMRVSADGGTPELIVPAARGETLWAPQLLPGGDAVLFTVLRGGAGAVRDGEIAVHSLTSGQRTIIAQGASDARYVEPGHLIYGARNALMAVKFDVRQLTVTGAAVPVAEDVRRPIGIFAGGTHYAVSANGTVAYVSATALQRSLYWVDRDGRSREPVTTVPIGPIEDPRLSPDGSRVLLTRDGDIWTYDLASGRANRVTRDGGSQMGAWDPTGTRIAYSVAGKGGTEAWVASADGSGTPRQLTTQGGIVHVDSWSPDGRFVAVHRHSLAGAGILLIAVDDPGLAATPFAAGEAAAEGATFARDGRHVAYLSMDPGAREIFIRPFPGPGGRLTVSVNGGVEPLWAPSGEVFYRNPAGDRMFSVTTRATPTMTVGRPEARFAGRYYVAPTGSPRPQYDVTADGRRFLMITAGAADGDDGDRFVVVQNALGESRR